jgi:hypothetical protein
MDGLSTPTIRVTHHSHLHRYRSHPPTMLFLLLLLALSLTQSALGAPPFVQDRLSTLNPLALRSATVENALACQELLVNGALEASGGWIFGATPAPGTIVDIPVHAGSFALRLGIAGGNHPTAHSSGYQIVALPADANQITLTYWERPGTTGDTNDYREILAFRPNFSLLRVLERITGAGNDQWTQRTFDLTDLRGQSIAVYFNVYNNGSGATLVNYLDDLSLQSCDSAAAPTATATSPAPNTPTPTATTTVATTPASPTLTATATALPSTVLIRAGNVAVTDGQTTLNTPLDLVGATAERAVGVLSVDVQYDATKLRATACIVSSAFDPLLCNIATPGVIQLAGVAATALRTDVKLADLGFDILQPTDLSTLLTVKLDAVADGEGLALVATTQNGQIGAVCQPGTAGCPTAQNLYLPLVNR